MPKDVIDSTSEGLAATVQVEDTLELAHFERVGDCVIE